MVRLRRILLIIAITLTILGFGVFWIAPVALSINTARTSPATARLFPVELPDLSVSPNPGSKISHLGYEFEIPWNDIDDTGTKRYRDMTILTFRSGRRLMIGVSPPQSYASAFHASRAAFESEFGSEVLQSDYAFVKALYEFTPEKMDLWAVSPSAHYRQVFLLTIKDTMLAGHANLKILEIQNQNYRGFQIGEPAAASNLELHLYSNDGSVHITFFPPNKSTPTGITQPEINRIVQSLRHVPQV